MGASASDGSVSGTRGSPSGGGRSEADTGGVLGPRVQGGHEWRIREWPLAQDGWSARCPDTSPSLERQMFAAVCQ